MSCPRIQRSAPATAGTRTIRSGVRGAESSTVTIRSPRLPQKPPHRPFPSYPLPLFQNESTCDSYENVYHHVHFHANQSNFHLNGFAQRLVLKLRQKATRKLYCKNDFAFIIQIERLVTFGKVLTMTSY